MKKTCLIVVFFLIQISLAAQTINISGTVKSNSNSPINNADVTLANANMHTTTNNQGNFTFYHNEANDIREPFADQSSFLDGDRLYLSGSNSSAFIDIYDLSGRKICQVIHKEKLQGSYFLYPSAYIENNEISVVLLRVIIDDNIQSFKMMHKENKQYSKGLHEISNLNFKSIGNNSVALDKIIFEHGDYQTKEVEINNYTSNLGTIYLDGAVTVPNAPTGLHATAVSSSQIDLSWNDTNNEDGFEIESSKGNTSNWSQVANIGNNTTTFQHKSLVENSTYYYRVRAYNSAGNSGFSDIVNATTPKTKPNAPSNFTASAVSESQINLSWTDNSNNEDGFIIKLGIRLSNGSYMYDELARVSSNVTSYQHTGLSAGTTYKYSLCAYNSVGESSNVNANGTTNQPSSLTVYAQYDNSVCNTSFSTDPANKVYSNYDLAIGVDYYWLMNNNYNYAYWASTIKFDVQSHIAGRSIKSATLQLYVHSLRGEFGLNPKINVSAFSGDWNPSTLTYNTWKNLKIYNDGQVEAYAPSNTALPLEFNVTTIVANWASGYFNNYGFNLKPNLNTHYYPNKESYQTTTFQSLENWYNYDRRPKLVIEFY